MLVLRLSFHAARGPVSVLGGRLSRGTLDGRSTGEDARVEAAIEQLRDRGAPSVKFRYRPNFNRHFCVVIRVYELYMRCFRSLKQSCLYIVIAGAPLYAQQYTITTIAGNGTSGLAGNNGPATSAELSDPAGLALDAAGNLYIVDEGNNQVYEVTGGVMKVVAGTGTPGYGGDGGAATSAYLYSPSGIALDAAGNLYIADAGNNVIRMVNPSGTISTVVGTVCDDFAGCTASYAGDGGPASAAQMNTPLAIAFDSAGNLYITDSDNNAIREVSGGTINSIATNLTLHHPTRIAIDANANLYVTDTDNNRVVKISPSGTATVV